MCIPSPRVSHHILSYTSHWHDQILKEKAQTASQAASASQAQTDAAGNKEKPSQTSPVGAEKPKTTSVVDNDSDKQKSKAAAMSNVWRKEPIASQKQNESR